MKLSKFAIVTANVADWSRAEIGYTVTLVRNGTNADIDGNGTVDAADYVVWRNGLGSTHTLADYHVWRTNFGRALGGSAAFKAAEPAAALLLLAAAVVMVAHPSRRADGLYIATNVKLRFAAQIS